ncbi:MAG: hypothetical protein Q8Q09_27170 [Deltaproteobacteria bacterium]|nr:hypothetical protein [Deltaproteobacteria bacterium]
MTTVTMGHTMDRGLHDNVARYIDHLEDRAWVNALMVDHGLDAVLASCVDVLGTGDCDAKLNVMTLLRDLGIYGIFDRELVTQVRDRVPLTVLPALAQNLRDACISSRMNAIYTLGKLSFSSEIASLIAAFEWYLDRDAFCVARVLSELSWLGDDDVMGKIERVAAHSHPVIRWSALGAMETLGRPRDEDLQRWDKVLEALSNDAMSCVRNEARYQRVDLALGQKRTLKAISKTTRKERDLAWREHLKTQPRWTFGSLEIHVVHELTRDQRIDLSIDEIESLVLALCESPESASFI